MKAFPSIPYYTEFISDTYLAGNYLTRELVITEKLDGFNTLLHRSKVYDRSGEQCDADYVSLVKKHHAWKTHGNYEAFFWGEDLYAQHSCKYLPIRESETFRVFAVGTRMGLVKSWYETIMDCGIFDFKPVPVLFMGKVGGRHDLHSIITDLMEHDSYIGGDLEGLVIRPAGAFLFDEITTSMFKVVRGNHVQPNAEHWRKNWKPRDIEWE